MARIYCISVIIEDVNIRRSERAKQRNPEHCAVTCKFVIFGKLEIQKTRKYQIIYEHLKYQIKDMMCMYDLRALNGLLHGSGSISRFIWI